MGLRAIQTLDVLFFFFFFFVKKSCPMRSGLKFPLSYVTWFLPDNMAGPKEIVFRPVNKQK